MNSRYKRRRSPARSKDHSVGTAMGVDGVKPMQTGVTTYFEENEPWLTGGLDRGRATGGVRFTGPALDVARMLVGSLEGGMLVARSFRQIARFQSVADRLLADLSTASESAAIPAD